MLTKNKGFSLIELLVVVSILGILSISVGAYFNTSKYKLKTFVFNVKVRFNQARFEAVKRSRDVFIDFDLNKDGAIDDRFTIWVDENRNKTYDPSDEVIGQVLLLESKGQSVYVGGSGPRFIDIGSEGHLIADGVTVLDWSGNDTNRFRFDGGGDSFGGAVYFYNENGTGPWEVSVNTVGRIKVKEWRVNSGWGD